MNDAQIAKIYAEGSAQSHTAGLRAVYNAGMGDEDWVIAKEASDIAEFYRGTGAAAKAAADTAAE